MSERASKKALAVIYEEVVIPPDYEPEGPVPVVPEDQMMYLTTAKRPAEATAPEPLPKKPHRADPTPIILIEEEEAIRAFLKGTMVGLYPTKQALATIGQRRWTRLVNLALDTLDRIKDDSKDPGDVDQEKVEWYLEMCQKDPPKQHKRGAKKNDHEQAEPTTNYGKLFQFRDHHPEETAMAMLRVMCIMAPHLSDVFSDRAAAYEANEKLSDDMKAEAIERCEALAHAFDEMADGCAAIEAATTWKEVKEALDTGFPELAAVV